MIDADELLENADWTKRSWDLPETPRDFLIMIGADQSLPSDQRAALARFMKLPAAQAMPPRLKRSLIKEGLLD